MKCLYAIPYDILKPINVKIILWKSDKNISRGYPEINSEYVSSTANVIENQNVIVMLICINTPHTDQNKK